MKLYIESFHWNFVDTSHFAGWTYKRSAIPGAATIRVRILRNGMRIDADLDLTPEQLNALSKALEPVETMLAEDWLREESEGDYTPT